MTLKTLATVRKLLASAVLGAALLLSSPSASAAMALIYELDHRFSGSTSLDGPTPWAVATFRQMDANTVELHMRANNISGGYLNNWWFNFNGNASALQI